MKTEKKPKSKAKKIVTGVLKGLGAVGTLALTGYVVKEVKDEYDSTVAENDMLRDFINSHDFYEKQKTNMVSSDYKQNTDDEESTKFDPKNPVYKQSPETMMKLGLNPDGTSKSKPAIVRLEDEVTEDGYIVEVRKDLSSGMTVYKQTSRKVSDNEDTKEA